MSKPLYKQLFDDMYSLIVELKQIIQERKEIAPALDNFEKPDYLNTVKQFEMLIERENKIYEFIYGALGDAYAFQPFLSIRQKGVKRFLELMNKFLAS